MISYDTFLRVRYGETDTMGYVYYGNYALYCEVGRTELMRSLGLTYKKLEEDGYMLPVISYKSNYYKSARYDDLLKITTSIEQKPSLKIVFQYDIYNEQEELINHSESVLGFMSAVTQKPVRPPKYFEELMNKFFKQTV
jgi:acyl-CoA thioester hydrolase